MFNASKMIERTKPKCQFKFSLAGSIYKDKEYNKDKEYLQIFYMTKNPILFCGQNRTKEYP